MFLRKTMIQSVRGLGMLAAFSGATLLLVSGCPSAGGGGAGDANDNTGDGNTNVNDNTGGGNENGNDNTSTEPEGFANASVTRGGSLYDKWWTVAGLDEPTDNHPLWASRPDTETNTRSGSATWRCKECHGWDYKGKDGAYALPSSHHTGFDGIFGTMIAAQEAFDLIKTDHAFGDAGLSDEDIWDLARFVLDGQIDTDEIIDAGGLFVGVADGGQTTYESSCMACHGADGTQILFDGGTVTLGGLAGDNPWEVQHKIRFGQPGTPGMPAQFDVLATAEVGDLGAFSQTLPASPDAEPEPEGLSNASVRRGGSLYDKWWVVAGVDAPTDDHPFWALQDTNTRTGADTWRCKECHGWDYKGVDGAYGSGSHMTGFPGLFGTDRSAQEVFDKIETDHGFADAGLSADDIWDLARFVLEGQIDTDDIIDPNNAFIGDIDNGQTLYDAGIGGNLACAICHGADGLTINFKDPPDEEFIGGLAAGNPWEFQHKVRFGNPGTQMPATVDVDATNDDVADVGAYSQTLPETP